MIAVRKYAAIFILWVFASVGCFLAGCTAWLYFILYIWAKDDGYIRNCAEAQDRVLAAVYFMCSGRHTVSLEAAFAQRRQLRRVRAMLDQADPSHVPNSVINEHAYCRIRDRQPGDK